MHLVFTWSLVIFIQKVVKNKILLLVSTALLWNGPILRQVTEGTVSFKTRLRVSLSILLMSSVYGNTFYWTDMIDRAFDVLVWYVKNDKVVVEYHKYVIYNNNCPRYRPRIVGYRVTYALL